MEEEKIPKMGLNGNLHTTRPVGSPRTRWAEVVQEALQLLGIRGWRSTFAHRDERKRLMREAKARKGLQLIHIHTVKFQIMYWLVSKWQICGTVP
jgi:hypothetical protein